MDEQQPNPQFGEPQPAGDSGQFTQQFRHQQVSALVPEKAARGTFSTGVLILQGAQEFILDFILTLARPHQVAARVILPPNVAYSLIGALKQNLDNYRAKFGDPPPLPKPPANYKPPSVEEIYEQLKMPDQVNSGTYSNNVMITHSPSEFCFDFITSFYPRSSVAERVFLSAPQVPRMLETLQRSWDQYQRKIRAIQQQQNPFQAPDSGPPMPPGFNPLGGGSSQFRFPPDLGVQGLGGAPGDSTNNPPPENPDKPDKPGDPENPGPPGNPGGPGPIA